MSKFLRVETMLIPGARVGLLIRYTCKEIRADIQCFLNCFFYFCFLSGDPDQQLQLPQQFHQLHIMAAMLGSNNNKVLRQQLCQDSSNSTIFNTITKAFSSQQLIILPRTIIIHHKIIIKIMKRNHQTEMESYSIVPRTTVRILRIILSPMSTLVQSLYKARHELFSRKKYIKEKN